MAAIQYLGFDELVTQRKDLQDGAVGFSLRLLMLRNSMTGIPTFSVNT